jgi:hypothetical protein
MGFAAEQSNANSSHLYLLWRTSLFNDFYHHHRSRIDFRAVFRTVFSEPDPTGIVPECSAEFRRRTLAK